MITFNQDLDDILKVMHLIDVEGVEEVGHGTGTGYLNSLLDGQPQPTLFGASGLEQRQLSLKHRALNIDRKLSDKVQKLVEDGGPQVHVIKDDSAYVFG